jgi:hypothetical protein
VTLTCGHCRRFLHTRIYSASIWSTDPCKYSDSPDGRDRLIPPTSNPSHTLLRFLLVSNSLDLIIDLTTESWGAVVRFVQPYALKQILSSIEDPNSTTKSAAYYWTLVIFLTHLSFAQFDLFQSWYRRRCYERTRGQLFCALHYKALMRLDIGGKVSHEDDDSGNADLGKIINLMQ